MRRSLILILLTGMLVSAPVATAQEGDIVGGGPTTIEEWPWQVAIADPPARGGDGQQRQFCGGSLVSPTAVLTAAHCVDGDRGFQQPGEFSVITGRTTLSDDSSGTEIPVSDIYYFVAGPTPRSVKDAPLPRLYEGRGTSDWDVVILELNFAAPAPAEPIDIASAAESSIWADGNPLFATGYGTQAFLSPVGSDTLQEVELERIPDADCGDADSYDTSFLSDVMVCAGEPDLPPGGKDTCQGDSGGPLVAPTGTGEYRLIGDTSFGEGCALPEKWGVYGRLADSTMRPAIMSAIGLATGGGGTAPASPTTPSSPTTPTSLNPVTADRVAPETTLTKTPRKRSRRLRASFEWTATESATFVCQLDDKPAGPCTSPKKRRVRRGVHTFTVTATDAAGNVEATPETYSWKVKGKRKQRG